MGIKSIWDGKDLPPIGCVVLIHLGSGLLKNAAGACSGAVCTGNATSSNQTFVL